MSPGNAATSTFRSAATAIALWGGTLAGGLLASSLLDGPVYDHARELGKRIGRTDWSEMLRMAGYFPFWLVLASAFVLIDLRNRDAPLRVRLRRGELILWPTMFGGMFAEAIKLLVRRERPLDHDGAYAFRPWSQELLLSGVGLGMPSSHAAVAFAGAFILWRMYPAAGLLWFAAAAGCAFTRLLTGAHFLSDVFVGGYIGCLSAELIWRLHLRLRRAHDLLAARA